MTNKFEIGQHVIINYAGGKYRAIIVGDDGYRFGNYAVRILSIEARSSFGSIIPKIDHEYEFHPAFLEPEPALIALAREGHNV